MRMYSGERGLTIVDGRGGRECLNVCNPFTHNIHNVRPVFDPLHIPRVPVLDDTHCSVHSGARFVHNKQAGRISELALEVVSEECKCDEKNW